MGVKMDPENEQDKDECEMEDEEAHPELGHLDPNESGVDDTNKVQREKMFKLLMLET